jgi:virginiamycin B lyase
MGTCLYDLFVGWRLQRGAGVLIACAFLWTPVQAEAFIYSATGAPSGIARAELSGTGLNNSFLAASGPAGIAVDSQHIYWANLGTNSIGRANLDGTGVDQNFITGAGAPSGVAVDAGHVYWTNENAGTDGTGTIGRANLDGSGATQSFISGLNVPNGLAVDSGHIYWANNATGTIGRATFSGSGVTGVTNTFIVGNGTSDPNGVALDAGHIYWANFGDGAIGRANLDGSLTNQSFITGLDSPTGVAVDNGHVYWSSFADNAIGRANLDGSSPAPSFITGARQPSGLAVDGLATPPSTAIVLSPAAPNGRNGWYTRSVQVQAIGTAGGWPIDQTRCVVDPGAVPAVFSALPASACGTVAADGRHGAFAATRDTQGATSPLVSASFKIDATRPTVTCEKAPAFLLGTVRRTVTAVVGDHGSGPLSASVTASAKTSSPGNKTVTLTGSDIAGNTVTVGCRYRIKVNPLNPEPKLSARFSTSRGSSRVTSMRISNVPGRAKVTLKCSGKGCPFASLTAIVRKGKRRSTNLASLFHGHPLRPGAKVTVAVTQAHTTGRRWVFTTRRGGKRPTEKTGSQIS